MGLIVACAAGTVSAPIVGPAAGVAMVGVGLFDLAINWNKRIAERGKIDAETQKAQAEAKKAEAEAAKLRAEAAHIVATQTISDASFPSSQAIPDSILRDQAEQHSLSEGAARHLLNSGLPVYLAYRPYFTLCLQNS